MKSLKNVQKSHRKVKKKREIVSKQKTNNTMVDLNLNISIITFNINGLNTTINRDWL